MELTPVAGLAAQFPLKPVLVEEHCAKAGETPNTVAMPVASASPRNVPPAIALLASRRVRRPRG
jgi:hypothetical protein